MNFGKSLCMVCEQPLAGSGMTAHPSDCPTHHFHLSCLARHAEQDRRCPIDRIPFANIACDNVEQVPANTAPPKDEKTKSVVLSKSQTSQPSAAGKDPSGNVNCNTLPCSGLENIIWYGERDDVPAAQPVAKPAATHGELMCSICGRHATDELASPDCCNHWFHHSCLAKHTSQFDVCPFEGCYREMKSFTTASGNTVNITPEMKDYQNMITAPRGFSCALCFKPDLNLARASAKPCEHLFHRGCITDFVRQNKKCPICKTQTLVVECEAMGPMSFF